jgi:hypothetical protein
VLLLPLAVVVDFDELPLPPAALVVVALLVELEAAAPLVYVATTAGPVGDSLMESFARIQPDFAVSAAGHSTCWNVTEGLSAFSNQSKRQ